MATTISITTIAIIVTVFIFILANSRGKLSAQNDILKQIATKKAREQERANKIIDATSNMSRTNIRKRLRKIRRN